MNKKSLPLLSVPMKGTMIKKKGTRFVSSPPHIDALLVDVHFKQLNLFSLLNHGTLTIGTT